MSTLNLANKLQISSGGAYQRPSRIFSAFSSRPCGFACASKNLPMRTTSHPAGTPPLLPAQWRTQVHTLLKFYRHDARVGEGPGVRRAIVTNTNRPASYRSHLAHKAYSQSPHKLPNRQAVNWLPPGFPGTPRSGNSAEGREDLALRLYLRSREAAQGTWGMVVCDNNKQNCNNL